MLKNINFGTGVIKYNEFHIKNDIPLKKQELFLTEDLLQVEYKNKIILDLGWFPEFNCNGVFLINIIRNYDWNNPIFKKEVYVLSELKNELIKAINLINSLNKS